MTKEFNEATRQITIHEEDPVVKCSPGTEYPPEFKTGGCTSFVSTGVTLLDQYLARDYRRAAAFGSYVILERRAGA